MKKLLIIIVAAVSLFSGCKKDDGSIFSKSPDERINDALTAYQTQLSGATNGWKGLIYPKSGGIYTFYFKFNSSNRVQMLSSFDSASAVTMKESSYRLKAVQQPSLLFDTYSYLHVLADPNPDVSGGPVGAGLQSDFEYYFDSSSADTINLVGRFNGSKAVLVKATQAEATAFASGQLANGLLINKIQTYYKRLTIGSTSVDFYFDPLTRSIKWTDVNGNLMDSTRMSDYFLILGGIGFTRPITVGNQKISQITNLSFSTTSQSISATANNVAATIAEVIVPLKVDLNAPSRWWNYAAATDDYWYSIDGFHVNGVEDAYGVNKLISSGGLPYYFLIYYPRYSTTNDLFAPVFLDEAANSLVVDYGSAPRIPTFTADGRVLFRELGMYGAYPTTGGANASRQLLYNSSGFYLVQTSGSTYDMVSSRDGKSWITWYSSK
ncbi:DUF4302 domain-containing protein [Segetibacter aerophilus]|uniref:DUF4302 domain-containing protein n=1 Tax=Segetibacter aerophilus TaxID=670293 RepID=A0A512BFX7_9BACT|nr:DUF4302 domain-containing protein [Segetibacter aerophilus]GEO10874.1 hypothetical protein SAE01_33700 [Segetibacter aerophilus]